MDSSRQELVWGKNGQRRIMNSTVAVVGMGALGSVSAQLLVRAGIGRMILIDRDVVEESNLQRQLLYTSLDIGKSKVVAAREKLLEINPALKIETYAVHVDATQVCILEKAEIIVDGTDNMITRLILNDYAQKSKKTLIYGSAIKTSGYVMAVVPNGPCLRCFLQEADLETCDVAGVINTITPSIAALQATLVYRVLLGEKVGSELYYYDIWNGAFRTLQVKKRKGCPTCEGKYEYLEKRSNNVIRFCSTGRFQIKGKAKDLKLIKKRWLLLGKVMDDGVSLRFQKIILFADGRALIEAKTREEAEGLYSKYVGN